MNINWGGNVDQLVVSWQKPIGTYVSVFTLAALAIFVPDTRTEILPMLGLLAGINGGLRTYEKVKGATAGPGNGAQQ